MRKYIWLNTVFIIALAVLLVVSALHIATVLREEGTDDYYYGLQDSIVSEQTLEETTEPISSEATTPHEEQGLVPISVDLSALQAQFTDVVGWLYCENPLINYPIARGYDNNHLRHLLNGTYNTAGTLFADYRNGKSGADHNFVIFGHNVNNETMFGSIEKYKNQEYYESRMW